MIIEIYNIVVSGQGVNWAVLAAAEPALSECRLISCCYSIG